MTLKHQDIQTVLGSPVRLPCGVQLKHRLAKAAMSDSLGDGAGNATPTQMRLYERWAEGGAALSLIGEVQVTPTHPERPGNLVLGDGADLAALNRLAARGATNGAQIWPQLGHAGALSYSPVSHPKGPSPLDNDGLGCAGMTADDIRDLPAAYARAAALAKDLGFGGVQIHAGHGFLFSQFLSPLFNHRTDAYGGSVAARFRIVGETIDAVRHAVGPTFPIGIKINATDKLVGGLSGDDALEVIRLLSATSVDLIDISGGTYFPGAPASSEGSTQAGLYFADFARRARAITTIPIMLTGGFQTREHAVAAITAGAADVIGLARSMVLDQSLPNSWLSEHGGDPVFPKFKNPPKGAITAWYTMRLTALGQGSEATFDMTPAAALEAYEARDTERSTRWRKRFV